MIREVSFAPEALTDLFQLYDYIAADSDAERARRYTDRIVAVCRNLGTIASSMADGICRHCSRRGVNERA